MAQAQTASILLAAASATAVCASQTPGAAGALTINGGSASSGVATLDVARRVLITAAGNESGKTFTITGTDRSGIPQREVVAGPNTTTGQSVYDYKTVTSVVISAAAAGTITVGTSAVASSRWIVLSDNGPNFNVGYAVAFAGLAGSVTLEGTSDKIDRAAWEASPSGCGDMSAAGLSASTWAAPVAMAIGSAITVDTSAATTVPVRAVRITTASGATSGSIRLTVIQAWY